MHRIVLDPGHGGHDDDGKSTPYGARSASGEFEKDLNLQLAREVADRLYGQAVLTRTGDYNVSLAERIDTARRVGASGFVSIHGGARAPHERGARVWVHPEAEGGSLLLAHALAGALGNGGDGPPIMSGNLAVLSPPRFGRGTAGCMIEFDNINNPEVDDWLRYGGGLETLAERIAEGLEQASARFGSVLKSGPLPKKGGHGHKDIGDGNLGKQYALLMRSPIFQKEINEEVTKFYTLKLKMINGPGTADYNPEKHEINVYTKDADDKSKKIPTRVRDELMFELHNAKSHGLFEIIDGENQYNSAAFNAKSDPVKIAGYALANEWQEWRNVVESTIRIHRINSELKIGSKLTNIFAGAFPDTSNYWLAFRNYLKVNVDSKHTSHYDSWSILKDNWVGWEILQMVEKKEGYKVLYTKTDFKAGKFKMTARENPFLWTQLKSKKYSKLPKPKVVPKPPKRTPPVRKRWSFSQAAKM